MILAWHVDYWDNLGWKDTFALKEGTERQRRYQKARGLKALQTPHFFAANRPVTAADLDDAVKKEAQKKPRLAIEGRAQLEKGRVLFHGKLKKEGEGVAGEGITVQVLLFVKKAETKCNAGENKGKTLVEYFAVLEASKPVRLVDALANGVKAGLKSREFDEKDLGVAILVEDSAGMETIECAMFDVNPS